MKYLTPRRLLILCLALMLPIMVSTILSRATHQDEWPSTAVNEAGEIPLSEVYQRLRSENIDYEAAVLNDHIYIRRLPLSPDAAGDAPGNQSGPDASTGGASGATTVKALLPFPSHVIVSDLAKEVDAPIRIHRNQDYSPTVFDRFLQLLPVLLIVAIVIFLLKRGGMRSMGLNSSFTVIDPATITDSFETVAGIDSARGEIEEIVAFLKDPAAASRLGGVMPKGAIFSGPPGTGKTLLARAMAREAGVPFLSIEAAGINQLFVGAGAMKIKRAFREARKLAPCIVFIDEIDAMGRARGSSSSGAGDEKETTLNSLLVELDGFDGREGVVVIAATNRPGILDGALTRRGRIDRHIHIDLPDVDGREEILRVHTARTKIIPNLDIRRIAEMTFGFSGADLRALANEAALAATRAGKEAVELEDYAAARDRLLVGLSGSQRRLKDADRKRTAIHEAGHALVAAVLPDADPVEKATILPQGAALGFVMQTPTEDRNMQTRDKLVAKIRVAVAGRIAEEIFFGTGGATSGASSDIKAATAVARQMVTDYGMSNLGFVHIDGQDPILNDIHRPAMSEIRDIISREVEAVRTFLETHRVRLEEIALLLEHEETVDGKCIMEAAEDIRGHFQRV